MNSEFLKILKIFRYRIITNSLFRYVKFTNLENLIFNTKKNVEFIKIWIRNHISIYLLIFLLKKQAS